MSAPVRAVSERLREFVAEAPYERRPILDFVRQVASSLQPGQRLLDVGAGDAPYRELFAHVDYVTLDWTESPHLEARQADLVASAGSLPSADAEFDAALCTQVLEHLDHPARALAEIFRVMRPAGTLYLTAPLIWEEHEMPHDYFRYTSSGLKHLLTEAGFVGVDVTARNDCFTTIAQLLLNARWAMGSAPDGLDERRGAARLVLEELAEKIAALAPLDAATIMPLGFTATARKPAPRREGANGTPG